MSLLLRAGELVGRPVVTLDTAEDIAEVKDVVCRYDEARVVGFTLNKRGRLSGPLKAVLPWSRLAALGRDAVMVTGRDAVGSPDEAMSAGAGREDRVEGTTVMTDTGKALGAVRDVILEVDHNASVVGFEIHDGADARLLPVGDTLSLSGDALMVSASAEEFLRDDLTGFGGAVEAFRERLRGQEG